MDNASHQQAASPRLTSAAPRRNFDPAFRWLTVACGCLLLLAVAGILIELVRGSWSALEKFGAGFLVNRAWNPVTEDFGALSSIYGTLVSTLIALVLAVPLSLVIALFLVELAPPRVARYRRRRHRAAGGDPQHHLRHVGAVRLRAVHGRARPAVPRRVTGGLPLFQGPPMGIGMLTAGIILALMVLPFITAVMRDVFLMVPRGCQGIGLRHGRDHLGSDPQSHDSVRHPGDRRRLLPGPGPGHRRDDGGDLRHRQRP